LVNRLQLKITIDVEPQRLGEEEYDARIEYSFKLNETPTNDHLLHMINFFIVYMQHQINSANQEFTCAVVLTTKEFFTVDFKLVNKIRKINYWDWDMLIYFIIHI
jgi:hypothetical protein